MQIILGKEGLNLIKDILQLNSKIEQEKGIRGRGAVGKSNVAIMAELTVLENIETGK